MKRAVFAALAVAVVSLSMSHSAFADVHFSIDTKSNVQAISPWIYGVNNQSLSGSYQNLTLSRAGGNRLTAYNWENNASNAGSDWYFQNDNAMGSSNTPGLAITGMVNGDVAHNAASIITIPTVGYVAADKGPGGDVRNSGANYLQTRFKQNRAAKGSAFTLNPSSSDGNVYQDEFVNFIQTKYAASVNNPNTPIFYMLDNEPDLWSGTHAEVHPTPVTYAEIVANNIAYATAIKNVAPNTKVFGAVNYGFLGMWNLQNATDANGRVFYQYYMQQMHAADVAAGHRLVDVYDFHWYPETYAQNAQGGWNRVVDNVNDPAVNAARMAAPRSLWDSTYNENSWVNDTLGRQPINMLNRMQSSVNTYDPGMKLSMSEYNFGGGSYISGGVAQADVLGILGKQGVFSASEWPMTSNESFIAAAFEMFRNYDGRNSTFGDTSIMANTDDVADTSVYASIDSTNPNRMVLICLNKTSGAVTGRLNLAHFNFHGLANIYQLTSANASPMYAGTLNVSDPTNFSYSMPAFSVSTLSFLIVPEPASLGLLAGAAGALLMRRRRRG